MKIRKAEGDKKRGEKDDDKEKEKDEAPWWPPFHFNGRNALKS